jgi:hypothetical protein
MNHNKTVKKETNVKYELEFPAQRWVLEVITAEFIFNIPSKLKHEMQFIKEIN